MENNPFGQFETVSKVAADSAKELESINTKLLETLTQKNMDLFNSTMDLNNKLISTLGNVAGVQELVTEQLQLSTEYNGAVMATLQEAGEIVAASQSDYQSWIESGLKAFVPTAPKSNRKKAA
ncbi:MAG: phasin family protein [Gammaproteobacteria bacterium]